MEDYSNPETHSQGDNPAVTREPAHLRGEVPQRTKLHPGVLEESTAKLLIEAINTGDCLPNTKEGLEAPVQRRALLIAIEYENDQRNEWAHLPSTPNDVWRIYEILRQRGYEKANIRILAEGIVENPDCEPTKKNIIASLEWLVKGAREGDYRYFHFSGHGDAFETEESVGKETRTIPRRSSEVKPGDTEIVGPASNRQVVTHERIDSQVIDTEEIKYYNEAIITSYTRPPYYVTDVVAKEDYNRVRDGELNAAFSQLPKGCTLTTTMDCCHSGRIINNNFKLLGAGFRGECHATTEALEVHVLFQSLPQVDELAQQDELSVRDDLIHRSGKVDEHSLTVSVPVLPISRGAPMPQDAEALGHQGAPNRDTLAWFDLGVRMRNFFSPPVIKMKDRLPAEEQKRDQIKATMFAWSGCHQRQSSGDYDNTKGGYFTFAFWSAVNEAPSNITIRELHENVNKKIVDVVGKDQLQYTQLWTSLGDGGEVEARAKLNLPFIV